MELIPGDIVLVKDIVFSNGDEDKSKNGRPCLVLFDNDESVNALVLSGKTELLHLYNDMGKYIVMAASKQASIVNLDYVYSFKKEKIRSLLNNAGSDYFRIIKKLKEFHGKPRNYFLSCCFEKLTNLEKEKDILEKALVKRQKDLDLEKRIRNKTRKSQYEEKDPIEEKLAKQKVKQYKMKKNYR